MKKLLLSAALLCATALSYAQMPDASSWKEGDEITEQVSWGNLSFTDATLAPWKLIRNGGNTTETGGLFEVYDGREVDLYQYVELPAGMYKVECQGYYRNGTSWADDPSTFGTENWSDNALLYASNGTYDIASDAFTAGRTFKTPLMPRLFPMWGSQIYEDTVKEGWDMSDGNYTVNGQSVWGPCSVPGSLLWFAEGIYGPYNDDQVKYNTVTFFLTEPGYARIGVRKTEPRSADSFMATNFKMYYLGEAGPAAELMALQDEVAEYYHMVEDLENKYAGLMYTLISDARMEFDGEYSDIESLTKEECPVALAYIKGVYENATAAIEYYKSLENVMPTMNLLYNSTDYAGKAEFGKAITASNNCLDENYEATASDDFGTFKTAYDNVVAARITYLLSQPKVNGAYDFSSAINNAFMCNNEYTPKWDAEANCYKYNDEIEETFATIQEQDYPTALSEHSDWIDYAGNFKFTEKDAEGIWVIMSTTWHGGSGITVTQQHGYSAIGGWTAEPTGNPEVLYQNITGLPNGYYSMSGLMCNAGAAISPLQFVFIEADGVQEKAQLTQQGNPWWGGNRDQWRQTVWEKLTTNMVYVSNGKVKIGSSSDAFYATTGFQLYYYGEEPDFASLLAPSIESVKNDIETLAFVGDQTAVKNILAKIPETIEGQEGYNTALATINEAKEYISNANAVVGNLENIINKFSSLIEKYPEASDESEIATTAFVGTLTVGESENDTYLEVIATENNYNAYVSYMDYREIAKQYMADADVAKVITEQTGYLKDNYVDAAKLAEMKAAIAGPYNKALLASLGSDKASMSNPVDVTALLINPNFDELSRGWDGEMTVDSLGTVERWNVNCNISQTLYSLPEGLYRVVAQAFYRDHGDAQGAYNNYWYYVDEETGEWANQNAKLYANENETNIVSIASETFSTRSYTQYVDKWVEAADGDEQGNVVWEPHWTYQFKKEVTDEATGEVSLVDLTEEEVSNDYPWDTKVDDLDEVFFYPASLRGTACCFAAHPNAYLNSVETYVSDGKLTLGVKKDVLIANDWVTCDNFKLYYLGNEEGAAIVGTHDSAKANSVYSVAGTRMANTAKGINIVKMSDGTVRKVFVK